MDQCERVVQMAARSECWSVDDSGSQSAHLLPVLVQPAAALPDLPALPSIASSARFIEIVIADAFVRVSAGTDTALLQLVLQSLRT